MTEISVNVVSTFITENFETEGSGTTLDELPANVTDER